MHAGTHTHTHTRTVIHTSRVHTQMHTWIPVHTLRHIHTCLYTLHTHGLQIDSLQHTYTANTHVHMYTQPHTPRIYTDAHIHSTAQVTHTGAPTQSHMNTSEHTFPHTCICAMATYTHMTKRVHVFTYKPTCNHTHTICSLMLTHLIMGTYTLCHSHIHVCTHMRTHLDTKCVH